jgi:FeS assembly SUF system regulator
MIRIGRLTDYGIIVMTHLAHHPDRVHNAHEVARGAHLKLPTVSKLLRILARTGLLTSHRGINGGYSLARSPQAISVAEVIRALEGPIALTACTIDSPGECEFEPTCPVRGHWQKINRAIREALDGVSIAQLAAPAPATFAVDRLGRVGV